MQDKKKCNNCQEIKCLDDFYVQKRGLLGRTGSCKVCRKGWQKAYQDQKEVKERRKINCALWMSESVERKKERADRFKKLNPSYWMDRRKQR